MTVSLAKAPLGISTTRPEIGQIVIYRNHLGDDKMVRVSYVDDDIKNGRPGFEGYCLASDTMYWGYDDQIV